VELLVRDGFVYDPINGVKGDKMDIAVKDGKIVASINERKARKIDASGMLVMPGGVDIHCHIAGAEVNAGRLLRPEDHRSDFERRTSLTRSGVGHSIPSTFTTGYRYARMGYTTIMNPSMPPLEARHTHEELNDTPMVDKGSYPLLGDWWFVLEYLRDNRIEDCARHVAWMMTSTKGYAIKIVNPGGLEAWGFGNNVSSLDDQVPSFCVTPREIIRGLCKVNRLLTLPHTIHVHTNNLGRPGNYLTTLETMKSVEDLAVGSQPAIHITHCQFGAFGGDDWRTMDSGAAEIADYVNTHSHVTMDMGQIIFGDTTTMTADGPFQYTLHELNHEKWVNDDVETETSAGIVPFHYRRRNYVNAVQWTIGLELALLIKDPWKIFMTTDHPNAGPFTSYPKIIAWLISRKARDAALRRINQRARNKTLLSSLTRELDFYELTIMTRAGQAKALSLKDKGNLGIGADADIAVYNVNPRSTDPGKDYKRIRRAFGQAAYTVKDGRIVVKNGEIVQPIQGRTLWLDVQTSHSAQITEEMKRRFKEYWTVENENYPVSEEYLRASRKITVKASV
jgi:formylmethanofuran dehydrogenase subunit A